MTIKPMDLYDDYCQELGLRYKRQGQEFAREIHIHLTNFKAKADALLAKVVNPILATEGRQAQLAELMTIYGKVVALLADLEANHAGVLAYSTEWEPPAALAITTATLPQGFIGSDWTRPIEVSGGYGPFSYAVTAGALPAGLALDAQTGIITGTLTTLGTSTFTVTVTDDSPFCSEASKTTSKELSIDVVEMPPAPDPEPPVEEQHNA